MSTVKNKLKFPGKQALKKLAEEIGEYEAGVLWEKFNFGIVFPVTVLVKDRIKHESC